MREKRFRICITILCLLALAASVLLLGELVKPVWGDDPLWEPATDIVRGFYAEEENSLDVLFLGSSHVFCGVSPLAVYDQTGLKSYDLAGGMQRTWMAYHYLVEALKTQSPSVVVLDTAMLFEDSPNEEGRNRMAIDYMRPSANKWAAARASLNEAVGETMLSYYLPLLRFHDRILALETADFTLCFGDDHNYLHGYRYAYMDTVTPVMPLEYDPDTAQPVPLWAEGSRALEYLQRILDLCEAEGIHFALITVPVSEGWSAGQSAAVAEFARANGIEYRDFACRTAELGLDGQTDFYDKDHLNTRGADIFSRQLGTWLLERYFAGETKPADPVWEADLARLGA